MMIPRAYSAVSSPPGSFDEKENFNRQSRPKEIPKRKKSNVPSSSPTRLRHASLLTSASASPSTSPSTSTSYRQRLQPAKPTTTTRVQDEVTRPRPTPQQPLRRRQSAQDILAATAIPIRRRARQRPQQRLPNCDHVSDFSRLLQDDIKAGNGGLSSSVGNPQFDGLFGNIDELVEGGMIVGSDGLDAGILTTRSLSTESIVSLASPDDFSSADNASTCPSPSVSRPTSDRKVRQMVRSESCESEHPLIQFEKEDTSTSTPSIFPQRKSAPRPSKPSAFKSSLTASLKAIKSAAQSVSNYATTPSIQPDEFLSHSIFDFQPSMTDDRRPPPTGEPPSPALRRYLNPDYSTRLDSPAQLHFWLDHRSSDPPLTEHKDPTSLKPKGKRKAKNKSAIDSKPRIVPLATCLPSAVRTAHASSPPIWLAADGTPSNKRTAAFHGTGTITGAGGGEADAAFGGLKQREPRENRDFLRVFVAEMEMRRHGKLEEGSGGRARMWLPPVEETPSSGKENAEMGTARGLGSESGQGSENGVDGASAKAMDRWRSWSADEL